MTYTNLSLIRRQAQRSELDLDALTAWVKKQGGKRIDDFDQYAGTLFAGCLRLGIDPFVLLGQGHLETGGWTSSWFATNLNPAGIGVVGEVGGTSDGTGSQIWTTGSDAAFGHLAHMGAYLWAEDLVEHWPDAWPDLIVADQRFMAPIRAGYLATNLASLGRQKFIDGKWRGWSDNDPEYGTKLAARANMIYEAAGKDVAPVVLNIRQALDWSGPNRPRTKLTAGKPLYITFHDTGNPAPSADATMHLRFVTGGAGVSFHFVVDDTGLCWQMLPLDEVGYHAADGCNNRETDIGCFQSVAIEMCVNGDNWKCYGYVKDLMAAIIAGDPRIDYGTRSYKDFSADRIVTHKIVSRNDINPPNGKWCPAWALNNQLYPADTIQGVKNRLEAVEPKPDDPQYAKPQPVAAGTRVINERLFLGVTETYVLAQDVAPRLYAEETSPATGPVLKAGTSVTTSHVVKDIGLESELTLVLKDGSRIPASVVQGGQ